MPHTITVRHTLGSYPVYVEPGVLQRINTIVAEHLRDRLPAMIADANVYALYLEGRLGSVAWKGETFCVPPGEVSKSRESWARLTDELLGRRFGRDSGLIGLGGGVVGDITGFVAATFMRGIPYILAPTTLLAMLDASVGGKTGVNVPEGKNLIGAFHQPSAVLADPLVLGTLPEREYRGGLAEAVKHGLIADVEYFEWIEAESSAILRRDADAVTQLVRRSVELKAEVVSSDERESGRRAILNAGHTVAHALEQLSGYRLPHGEAVALGLVPECEISERRAIAPQGLRLRVAGLLSRLGLPIRSEQPLDLRLAVASMASDKKNRRAVIHCALPAGIGRMYRSDDWTTPVTREELESALVVIQ